MPVPSENQVLVKVLATPFHPVDLYILSGTFAILQRKTPFVPGFEGSGVVVGAG